MALRFTDTAIELDGAPALVLGGEFQYFRIRRSLWEGGLRSLRQAGVNLISTYVPWIWHELEEGDCDFTGRTLPERDLVGFLDLCRREGLPVVVKPGPYIYAEYQGFGIPLWVRDRYPQVRMQVAGVPDYPEITLNHPEFLALVRRWFAAVAPHLHDGLADGSIVALQLDNETGMPQFGAGPYLVNRNPVALERLRAWLQAEHGEVQALNTRWGTRFLDWEAVQPPEGPPTDRSQLVDLARFVEDDLVDYLETLKGYWHDLGIRTHFYLNDVWIPAWPNHFPKKNRVAPLGYDPYPKFIRIGTPLDQPYTISYLPRLFRSFLRGGPLYAPEIGCGWLDTRVTVPPVATWQEMLASYLHGAAGCVLYPIHDGIDPDHHGFVFHAALDASGHPTPRMQVVQELGAFVADWGPALASSREVTSPVAILHHQEGTYDLLRYMVDPLDSAWNHMDDAIDRSVSLIAANAGLYGALAEAGYAARVLDSGRATAEDLAACKVLFFTSNGPLPEELVAKLEAYVAAGGHLVTLGIPFAGAPLFPGGIRRTWRPQALSVVAGTFLDLMGFQLTERAKITHPLVRFTIEKLQPVMGIVKHATRTGTWLRDEATGDRVWGGRFVSYVRVPDGAERPLTYLGAPVGYRVTVGEGSSTLLGTLLGPIFDSPGYYLDDPAHRASVSRLLGRWLRDRGVEPVLAVPPGVEAVVREVPDGDRILAVFNRGDACEVRLDLPWGPGGIIGEVAFSGSQAMLVGTRLTARMAAADVLVLRWRSD